MHPSFISRRLPARVVSAASLALSIGLGVAPFGSAVAQTTVPAALTPSDASHVVASLKASGTQIYVCKHDANNQLTWSFKAPNAELYDASGELIVTHSAGPSWAAADGSKITGQMLQQAPSSDPVASIPQLLLRATSVAGPGLLAKVRYVQRLDTHGGVAPTGACTQEGQEGRSPYTANYVFLD
jgi:hypothetical protein